MLAVLLDRLIALYQRLLSPLLPPACRFHPSCSAYAREAIRIHGAGKGSLLAAWRLCRCQPFSRGGLDPVPPRPALPHEATP
jgi:putative membrane protein insertion efficiency factor